MSTGLVSGRASGLERRDRTIESKLPVDDATDQNSGEVYRPLRFPAFAMSLNPSSLQL